MSFFAICSSKKMLARVCLYMFMFSVVYRESGNLFQIGNDTVVVIYRLTDALSSSSSVQLELETDSKPKANSRTLSKIYD